MNEQIAQAIKMLRNQAQDNLALANWIESLKIVETPTPPVQEETNT